MSRQLPAHRIWAMPILLGVSSAIGLSAALLGDGIWDVLSWISLGVPVLLCLRYLIRPSTLLDPTLTRFRVSSEP